MGQPDVTANDRMVSDRDTSKYGGIGIDGHIVLNDRVARNVHYLSVLVGYKVLCSQCNSLIESNMLANDTGLSNYNPRAMVNREILADLCSRVNVDSRGRVRHFRQDTWNNAHAHLVQTMCHTVVNHRLDNRIAIDNLIAIIYSRVVGNHSLYIGLQHLGNLGKRLQKPLLAGLAVVRSASDDSGKEDGHGRVKRGSEQGIHRAWSP